MPSFDVVSEVDKHELTNAIDQANRELSTRFDFKGVEAKFELDDKVINQSAPSDFQLNAANLADKKYIAACNSATWCYYGYPRTLTATARFQW